jgi:hypothetical protein
VQLLLVRHALPLRSEHGEGSPRPWPVAAALDAKIEIDDRRAEYDRDLHAYVPVVWDLLPRNQRW